MKKDLFLEYYVIENIVNKLDKGTPICKNDYIILKELGNIFDTNIVVDMILNDKIASYSDYINLLYILNNKIYNDYGILL